jgi:hypothetical protein
MLSSNYGNCPRCIHITLKQCTDYVYTVCYRKIAKFPLFWSELNVVETQTHLTAVIKECLTHAFITDHHHSWAKTLGFFTNTQVCKKSWEFEELWQLEFFAANLIVSYYILDSSVSKVSDYKLFDPRQRQRIFPLASVSRPAL